MRSTTVDLPDSEKDKVKMQPEEVIFNFPEVKDIPGQENIYVPGLKEMADNSISSGDEEGVGVFGKDGPAIASGRLSLAAEIKNAGFVIVDEDRQEDEPGKNDKDNTEEDDIINPDFKSEESDVTEDEKNALERTEQMNTPDNENLFRSELDNTDFDGEQLNEREDLSGNDLDIPGVEDDDANEDIGAEDEENNAYSLGDNN